MRRLLPLTLVCAIAALALAACGAEKTAAPPAPPPTPAPQTRCVEDAPSTPMEITTDDGVKLAGASFGSGSRGVVLLHQSNGDLCGWYKFAADLGNSGYHAVAIDFRCYGFSGCDNRGELATDAKAAVDALRKAGATKVTLLGASIGAATALVAAARQPDEVTAVIALSPHQMRFSATAAGGIATPAEAAAALKIPTLVVIGRTDPDSILEADAKTIVAAPPTANKRLVALDSGAHGWGLLPSGVDKTVKDFLAANG